MKAFYHLPAVLAVVLTVSCMKNDRDKSHLVTGNDKNFLIQASHSNFSAITAGNLAAAKASTDAIRLFGQAMAADHIKAQAGIDSLAFIHGIGVPKMADSPYLTRVQPLAHLSGRSFDSAYTKSQVADHRQAIDLFKAEIDEGNNKAIKDFAARTLPAMQMHYEAAMRLAQPYQ